MTKEEAYEKLELPVGTDLHIVRQKFQQMHNEFQVQIDGAFREDMRQKLQTRLMELEEAYKLLIGSEKMDDSGSLPHTEQTFEKNETKLQDQFSSPFNPTLSEALALFGLEREQNALRIEQKMTNWLTKLWQQHESSDIPAIKDAYRQEISKAEAASHVILTWLQEQNNTEPKKARQQNENTFTPEKTGKKQLIWPYISVTILLALALIYLLLKPKTTLEVSETSDNAVAKDSPAWQITPATQDSLIRINQGAVAAHQEPQPSKQVADVDDITQKLAEQQRRIKQLEAERKESSATSTFNNNQVQETINNNWREKYDKVYNFHQGLARVSLNSKLGFVDETGREVVSPKYESSSDFWWGLARVELNDLFGYIDKNGKVVIAFKYDFADNFSHGLARIELNKKWGFIDTQGQEVIPLIYEWAETFSDGIALIKENGTYAFIDKEANKLFSLKYDFVRSFSEGLAAVGNRTNGVWQFGYIDKTNQLVIPLQYKSALPFYNGTARVELANGKTISINKSGKCVKDCPD